MDTYDSIDSDDSILVAAAAARSFNRCFAVYRLASVVNNTSSSLDVVVVSITSADDDLRRPLALIASEWAARCVGVCAAIELDLRRDRRRGVVFAGDF